MRPKEKITFTLDGALVQILDQIKGGRSRSSVIQAAVTRYLRGVLAPEGVE